VLTLRSRLLALLVFFPLPLLAQYASDAEKGFKVGYTYDTSDFDAVSVWTGNLVVNIPIITYPQRGKVSSFGLHLVYNGKSRQQVQPVKTQQAQWKFTGNGVQLAYAPAYGLISGSVFDGTSEYFYAQIVDAYGTIHDQGTTGVAMDGSGLANGRDRNGNLYGQWGSIVDLDGNSVTPNLAKDSLGGDYLTGWTDTVGRVIPAPPGIQYMSRPGLNAGVGGSDGINTVCKTTSFPGQSGGTVPINICYSTYTATSNFQQQYVSEGTGQFTAISSVTLPNQTSWSFTYNNWGDLQTITLPTGGTATYQWQTTNGRVTCNCSTFPNERAIQSRTLTPTPGSSTGVITSTYDYSGSSGAGTVKVTNSAGDYVIHTGNPETEARFYDHALGIQKTVDTTYAPSYISPYAIVDNN
jgi:YD repeat-containing protein